MVSSLSSVLIIMVLEYKLIVLILHLVVCMYCSGCATATVVSQGGKL